MHDILPCRYQYAGVYMIENLRNKKVYIGSTSNIEERLQAHRSALRRGKHSNKALQEDFNQHHIFRVHILYVEAIPRNGSHDRNKYYAIEWKFIEKYNAIESGYNKLPISRIRQNAI